ncbi:SDR family NAD(P)-dependent oxidoreductase [Brachybacterium sacelli]|uniref:NAD(P)-dependent dehydrogenase (Short-subunit alcohol dehydrogenase family) n=1 Tax=Brachybacterium sacelli TaxID=173364 RepID=A0ABS4X1Z0_9MICO|nr:SDR family NAD(P)-dependent oxidoreductase [Brachybacterium sacelli]MBP2382474.1 NAD(P)-dependent dehydrogenase (short-subunit alcohol dehydrogenase family) [Brachybacterium sacelli]
MSRITTRFNATSTADDVTEGLDLSGRRAVVTGAASGIGLETARSLARAGAEVTLAVRRPDNAQEAARDIRATTGNDAVHLQPLDLADQKSVAAFTTGWAGPLDLLINNAGVMALPELTRTPEGWEAQFAVNHLGHFALALGLHEALASAPGARIVSVSSSGHHGSPVIFEDIHYSERPYDPWSAYGQSKTANSLFTVEATRRWADDGIIANAVMPGGIMTGLQRHLPAELRAQWEQIPTNKTPQQGAATSLVAAVAPEFASVGGRYLEDGGEAAVLENDAETDGVHGVRRWALDPEAAERLWETSAQSLRAGRGASI